jgi:SAM-dependent methyltransferase
MTGTPTALDARAATLGPSRLSLMRMFLADRGASLEFATALADRAIASLPFDVHGRRILDLGCGPGVYSAALARAGASVVSTDLDAAELNLYGMPPECSVVSDGRTLPFPCQAFDAVVCSNVLEHTPEPYAVLAEIERVLRPGGRAYVSWTNWYSPWGGHAVAPLHYLGPERSLRVWRRLFGEPRGRNLPLAGVWPTTIGGTLRWLRGRPGVQIDAVLPRYWPRLRGIMRIPGLREVVAWNCVIVLTRSRPAEGERPRPRCDGRARA